MLIPDKDYRKNISNYSTFIWLLKPNRSHMNMKKYDVHQSGDIVDSYKNIKIYNGFSLTMREYLRLSAVAMYGPVIATWTVRRKPRKTLWKILANLFGY